MTARQSIGLAVRTRPGTGATVATIASGTDLPATCTDTRPTIYGWRGGRSNQWIRVTTHQGTGYAPEAWLQTSEPARDLLPAC
ncbi:SH3 domain-containing protein [Embleya sp. NPDC059237]|uniref:SH3 domain-containing protein n=1 Tax=Embleya sp. NPDC059237 TaxID=3346784 RepID=UPI003694F8BC